MGKVPSPVLIVIIIMLRADGGLFCVTYVYIVTLLYDNSISFDNTYIHNK